MRDKLQQSWVHHLEPIRTGLHQLFYNHLNAGEEKKRCSAKLLKGVWKQAEMPFNQLYIQMSGKFTWSMYGLTNTCPTRASASRVLSMVAYVLRQWRTMSTLDVCRPSISRPSRDCCSIEVIPAIRWQETEPFYKMSQSIIKHPEGKKEWAKCWHWWCFSHKRKSLLRNAQEGIMFGK